MAEQNPELVKLPAWNGETPIYTAIFYKRYKLLKKLIEMVDDINKKTTGDYDGDTPLHMAIVFGNPKAAEILLDYGADPMIKNKMGQTAYEAAKQQREYKISKILDQYKKDKKNKIDDNTKTPPPPPDGP